MNSNLFFNRNIATISKYSPAKRMLMRSRQAIILALLLGHSVSYAVDYSHFSDMCSPTAAQHCPNNPEEVRTLQEALNADPNLYLYIKEDGQWSQGTKAAVIVFQEQYGIAPANGYFGKRSRTILQKVVDKTFEKPVQNTPKTSSANKNHTLPKAKPTREFVLYGDMCDNAIQGNHCPNRVIEVSNMQILLNADHNLNINIAADGKWGAGTQRAVVAFQRYYGITPATGYVGRRTKIALDRIAGAMVAHASTPKSQAQRSTNKSGSAIHTWKNICETTATDTCPNRPSDVRALQAYLNHALHLHLAVDGKWGKGTKQAVISFQKKNGINPASGYVGGKTRRIMKRLSK